MNNKKAFFFETTYKVSAFIAASFLLIIIVFIFASGLPVIKEYGLFNMLFNSEWAPNANPAQYGLLYMVLTTLFSTFISLFISVPIGVFSAAYLSKIASKKVKKTVMFFVDILAGIPSVIYGFFILKTLVKFIDDKGMYIQGISGNSMLAAIVVLALMALPTIISVATTAFDATDKSYKEASLALGANETQTIFKVDLRAAFQGVMAAIVLGAGKVVGETMAVMLVSGNAVNFPGNLLEPVRTLTANIATEMAYASGLHQSALYATGIVLFVIIMILNYILLIVIKKGGANNA
ncbi:phosphate transport system permease protein [Bacilli bacterium PM5-3]|nr:phosphate transport system permease protein [Bacilli bacterium PM5-3]MDH6603472.1 phosphate transport system permease protein [Bacilli bacterium PM5-9]